MNLNPNSEREYLPFPSHIERIGLAVILIPLLASFPSGKYEYVSLVCGIVATMTILPMARQLKEINPINRVKHIAALVLIDFVGVLHILRGIGVF